MKKLTDEMLNKYIDGELDSLELSEIKNEIMNDDEALVRLKALQVVDNTLRMIEVDQAPVNITERIMNSIATASPKIKSNVSYFFLSIISFFSIGVLAILITAFISIKKEDAQSVITPYADKAKQIVGNNLDMLIKFFSNQNVMFIASILTLILIISAYFTFESYKNFKNKLNRISH